MAAPTTAQLVAAIYAAYSDEPSWADIAKVLKKAIIFAALDGSNTPSWPWQSVNSDGTSITRVPLADLKTLYAWAANMDTGGIVGQYGEVER